MRRLGSEEKLDLVLEAVHALLVAAAQERPTAALVEVRDRLGDALRRDREARAQQLDLARPQEIV